MIRKFFKTVLCMVFAVGAGSMSMVAGAARDETMPSSMVEAANKAAHTLAAVLRGKTVVVLDPRPFNQQREDLIRFGSAIGDELRHAFDRQRGVTVLEQARMDEALRELRLNQNDLFDPEQRKRFGHFTGTRVIVISDLVEGPETIELVGRVVRLKTGEVLKDVSVLMDKDPDTFRLRGLEMPALIRLRVTGSGEVYVDGNPAGYTNRFGRLDLEIDAGRHRIEVKRNGYVWNSVWVTVGAGETVDLEVSLISLPDPDGVAVRSMLIPGWGDLALGHGDFWIYPLVVYGSIYGAMVYRDKADEWIVTEDSYTGKETLRKRGSWPVYAFAALAIGVWIYDVKHVYRSAKEQRVRDAVYHPQPLTVHFIPDQKGWMASYQWDF